MAKASGIDKIYPLTPMQSGMLFNQLLNPSSSAYFIQYTFSTEGFIDYKRFEESLNLLIERYDILRTAIVHQNISRPRQVVLTERKVELTYQDFIELTELEQAERVAEFKRLDRERSFDLTHDPLMRVGIIQTGMERYSIVWSYHHIVMDGWCIGTLLQEFFQIYDALRTNQPLRLQSVRPYSEYISWLEKQDQDASRMYWQHYLADMTQSSTMVKHKVDEADIEHRKNTLELSESITKRMHQVAIDSQVTLNTLFLAMWGIVVQKYNRSRDVVFGSVVSGRSANIAQIEQMVGLFINTIPVRVSAEPEEAFNEVLSKVQVAALASEPHSYFPLYEIQGKTQLKQDLLDHIVVFENYPVASVLEEASEQFDNGFVIRNAELYEQTSYNLNVIVVPNERLSVTFEYHPHAIDDEVIEQLKRHLLRVIEQVLDRPSVPIGTISLLAELEQEHQLVTLNQTEATYPSDKTLHELFEQQVERAPEQVAIIDGDRKLTYRELNERANRLAHVLQQQGVGPDQIVGIIAERSIEMMIGIYAILKSGGAYLPVDPSYPQQRINYMLEDSGARLLLVQESTAAYGEGYAGKRVYIDREAELSASVANVKTEVKPHHLAYVIYTSGSTGQPKGVMVEHTSVVNRLHWMQKQYPISAGDVLMQKTPISFDVSVWELLWWGIEGATVALLSPGAERDPQQIIDAIRTYGVTVMHFVPSMLDAFTSYVKESGQSTACKGLRQVFSSGEALKAEQVRRFYAEFKDQPIRLTNLYGPTEATVDVTYYDCTGEEDQVPIGKPIDNIQLYVVDDQLQLVPEGVAGELCIGGVGLARGYYNREELTREKFVDNPYQRGQRMYRTGDLVQRLLDGNIAYLGRIDEQVKIRGYRIECGEIEQQLLRYEEVESAVVAARQDEEGRSYLCAYVTAEEELSVMQLRLHLMQSLPEYMVPSMIVQVEQIPLTANGKADKKALRQLETGYSSKIEYNAATNEVEALLIEAWEEVLGGDNIGTSHPFVDLGGDSIKAIQVASYLMKKGYHLDLGDVFLYPTIKELSPHVRKVQGKDKS